jgi:5'-deoxynucleotidase YfbR-like HD superfamily hydrolase
MTVIKDDQWISLLSGGHFNYNKPEESDVTIEDIASALSNVCRFSGHLPRFYSVAQHLVNASRIVSEQNAFTALMHDTAEAFTNDLPTPLKWALPIFKELETKIEAAMAQKFGFEFPYPTEVKSADTTMLILEKRFVKEDKSSWPLYEEVERNILKPKNRIRLLSAVDLESWQPRRAKREFLERFYELQEKKSDSEGIGETHIPESRTGQRQAAPSRHAA